MVDVFLNIKDFFTMHKFRSSWRSGCGVFESYHYHYESSMRTHFHRRIKYDGCFAPTMNTVFMYPAFTLTPICSIIRNFIHIKNTHSMYCRDYDELIFKDAIRALSSVPTTGVVYSCAYGSNILEKASSQLDILIVVSDDQINEWHAKNIEMNPGHYFPRCLPSLAYSFAKKLQTLPPGVLFHIYIEHPSYSGNHYHSNGHTQYWKYGVVGLDSLLNDLRTWECFYIAGRLHKPILNLPAPFDEVSSKKINASMRKNLNASLASAMLMLPKSFSEFELFYSISALSYAGDIRIFLGGENPSKVRNIVHGRPENIQKFRTLYKTSIQLFCSNDYLTTTEEAFHSENQSFVLMFEQDMNKHIELVELYLPKSVQDVIIDGNDNTREQVRERLKKLLYRRVRKSSIRQLIYGILANSPIKTAVYALSKLCKRFWAL